MASPPPGRMIDVGGHRLHAHISGEGCPAVVLEAGIGASSISWTHVRKQLARSTRVCAYDRAGLGWSEAAPSPRTLDNILQDLRKLTANARIEKPFILAGHSFGGLIALEYACRYKNDLAGLALVDPLPASEWCPLTPENKKTLARGVQLSRRGAVLARVGVVRLALSMLTAGSRRLPRIFARVSSGNGAPFTERMVAEIRKLPPETWPDIQEHWCQPKSFASLAEHLENLPANAAACRSKCDLGDLPLVLLSAADSTASRAAEHARVVASSTSGRLITAAKSGHWILLDEPELVVSAIRGLTRANDYAF